MKFRRYFHDSGPDDRGRRRFVLCWDNPDGRFALEPSPIDGRPGGYRRAQEFRTNPVAQTRELEKQGHTVEEPDAIDPYDAATHRRKPA